MRSCTLCYPTSIGGCREDSLGRCCHRLLLERPISRQRLQHFFCIDVSIPLRDRPDPEKYLGPLILYALAASSPVDAAALMLTPALRHLADQNEDVTKEVAKVLARMQRSGLVLSIAGTLSLSEDAAKQIEEVQSEREQVAAAAYDDFRTKLKSNAPLMSDTSLGAGASQFEAVLVEAYRKHGLNLASSIFTRSTAKGETLTELYRQLATAASLLSAQEERSAFTIAAHQFLIDPTPAQKVYLESVSQGFFLYHLLGCDPTCSSLRLEIFEHTLWLVDSNVLLPHLARGCFQHEYARDLFKHLSKLNAQLFTTEKLAREAFEHLKWARTNTPLNPSIDSAFLATALVKGSVTQNLFIDGYIRLSAESQVVDFDDYLGMVLPGPFTFDNFLKHVTRSGVLVFSNTDIRSNVLTPPNERTTIELRIRNERETRGIFKSDLQVEAEAEVVNLLAAIRAKSGRFSELSVDHAYFVSTSRVLDRVPTSSGNTTWSAEAVYRYVTSLPGKAAPSPDLLQQCMLQEFYHAGTAFIDRPLYIKFFGPQIEEARLSFRQQKDFYISALEKACSPEELEESFVRTPDLEKPYFVAQMGWAVAAAAERGKADADERARLEAERARDLEAQVRLLEAQRSEAWRKREKRRQQQVLATERNRQDPKHVSKRLRQAKRREKKKH